jgi:hypothetical protein
MMILSVRMWDDSGVDTQSCTLPLHWMTSDDEDDLTNRSCSKPSNPESRRRKVYTHLTSLLALARAESLYPPTHGITLMLVCPSV